MNKLCNLGGGGGERESCPIIAYTGRLRLSRVTFLMQVSGI